MGKKTDGGSKNGKRPVLACRVDRNGEDFEVSCRLGSGALRQRAARKALQAAVETLAMAADASEEESDDPMYESNAVGDDLGDGGLENPKVVDEKE